MNKKNEITEGENKSIRNTPQKDVQGKRTYPVKNPETNITENTAKENEGLNQAKTIKKTPPLN